MGVWNWLAARERVKKRAYSRKKQAHTETITRTPDLGARRGVWIGLAAREGVNERAYGGIEQAYPETITQTPDLGARRGVVYNPGPRARREKGGLERARLRWKEAGLHGDCDPDPQTRRETGGLAAREGVKKRARLRRKEAGLHGDYNPDPRSRREKGGLGQVGMHSSKESGGERRTQGGETRTNSL